MDYAQTVMFAIQAGVRLYAGGRKAYVEATLDRPLLLPLPRGPGITVAAAANFFAHDPQGKIIAGAMRMNLSEFSLPLRKPAH